MKALALVAAALALSASAVTAVGDPVPARIGGSRRTLVLAESNAIARSHSKLIDGLKGAYTHVIERESGGCRNLGHRRGVAGWSHNRAGRQQRREASADPDTAALPLQRAASHGVMSFRRAVWGCAACSFACSAAGCTPRNKP
jgi:hypothetical protein